MVFQTLLHAKLFQYDSFVIFVAMMYIAGDIILWFKI